MKQREVLEEQFRPEIEAVKIDKTLFVKHIELGRLKHELEKAEVKIQKQKVESLELREGIDENKEKINELKEKVNQKLAERAKFGGMSPSRR